MPEWPARRRGFPSMTTTQQAGGASPVDFETFGDYGDFRRKQAPAPNPGEAVPAATAGRRPAVKGEGEAGGDTRGVRGVAPPGQHGEAVPAATAGRRSARADDTRGVRGVAPPGQHGEFVRPAYPFQGRITADGSSGY